MLERMTFPFHCSLRWRYGFMFQLTRIICDFILSFIFPLMYSRWLIMLSKTFFPRCCNRWHAAYTTPSITDFKKTDLLKGMKTFSGSSIFSYFLFLVMFPLVLLSSSTSMSFTTPNTRFPYLSCTSWVGWGMSLLSKYLFITLDWYLCSLERNHLCLMYNILLYPLR